MSKPRIFVTQPVADSALQRLKALGNVKMFPDDSRIIPHATLAAAVKKADILFCLLHDKIDRVIVDAPCSGLGTLRRNPDLKWRQSPKALMELTTKRSSILESAARLLKP